MRDSKCRHHAYDAVRGCGAFLGQFLRSNAEILTIFGGAPSAQCHSSRASIATIVRAAGLSLCLSAPGTSGELSERVVVVSKMADLRIKLVDHLADERWRVRTDCVSLSPTRVQIVSAFEDMRVELVEVRGDRTVCLTRGSRPLR